jgi:uncharacterized protein YegP (UPF0339 family)
MKRQKRSDRVEFYTVTLNNELEHRWRRVAPNGEIVGASTEGYRRLIDCKKNAIRLMTRCELCE